MPDTQSQDHYNKGAVNLQQYNFKVTITIALDFA